MPVNTTCRSPTAHRTFHFCRVYVSPAGTQPGKQLKMAIGTSRNAKGTNKAPPPPHRSSLRPKTTQHPLAESAEDRRLAILRAEKTRDQLLVNSVERSPFRAPPLTGLEHYMHMMHQSGLDTILSQDETDTHKPSDAQNGAVTNGTLTNGTTTNGTTANRSNTHPAHRAHANAPTPPPSAPTAPLTAPTPPQPQTTTHN